MKKYKYDISIVIPVYNSQEYIDDCIASIMKQKHDFSKIEVIFINDGSSDNSLDVCTKYEIYDNVKIINQQNSGVSVSRNKGMESATGKYIMFLDSDDMIQEDTISGILEIFEPNYDDIDLVSYKLKEMRNNKISDKLHYRNNYLQKTGVYDLDEFVYCSITTVNYVIKNDVSKKFKFDGSYQEDQKFATDIVMQKRKIGYTDKGCYLYRRHDSSVTNTSFYAYYVFESVTSYWENLFARYKKVPPYVQALFINDISWKTQKDVLKPYHFEGKEFDKQWKRIIDLLNQVEDFVILNHPILTEEYKYYFINLKTNNKFELLLAEKTSNLAIVNNNRLIYSRDYIDLHILKFDVLEKKINVIGYFLNPTFMLFGLEPKLYLITNNDIKNKVQIPIRKSSYSYSRAMEKTTTAWMFEFEIETKELLRISFQINMKKAEIPTKITFENITPFNQKIVGRDKYYKFNREYSIDDENQCINVNTYTKKELKYHKKVINDYYFYNDIKRWLFRKVISFSMLFKKKIWLYYDCKGVEKDNGYYQFLHDITKKDGIKKYFVTANNIKETYKVFSDVPKKKIIKFNSIKHKLFYLKASKIITAYIENNNCCPYTINSLKNYSDLFVRPEIIYLQHGVLHAHMPWKFSFDRLLIDKEVISTKFEEDNLKTNYCFTDEHLIKSGMPRYDFISQEELPKNKILFAPSWRRYLIGNNKGKWVPIESKFIESSFFKETYKFLSSKKLHDLLEKYDFTLDFKLHPIFNVYKKLYKFDSDRINFSDTTTKNSDYNIFLTDYSSFVFDFVYLKRAILYFVPDYDLFKAGLNLYRQLDLPMEDGFGELVISADETIEQIEQLLKKQCKPKQKYLNKTNNFFVHNDNNQRERIYQAIYNSKKEE